MTMLERLDDIPWKKYDDAYGPSVATPDNLRALASNDARRREKALDELSYTIYHQGTVYEATIYAVPFLFEMLAEPSYQGKAQVLELLQMLAEGTSYHDVHQHMILMQEEAKKPEFQEKVETEKGWVAQVKAKIRKGLSITLALLKDPDPAVRSAAIGLLVRMQNVATETREPFMEMLRTDADANVRAAALGALAVGNAKDPAVREALRDAFATETDPTCRASVAITLVGMSDGSADPDCVKLCREIACGQSKDLGESNSIQGTWEEAAILALASGDKPPDDVVERLIAYVETDRIGEQHAAGLLIILLGQNRGPWRREDFTALQLRGIIAVARRAFPKRNSVFINFSDVLKVFNLPQDRRAMEQLLGQELPQLKPRRPDKPWWKFW
jgi:hypothetical protein